MSEEVIKDPRSSFEIYGYLTNPITSKKEVVLYGNDIKLNNNKTINIAGSLLQNSILKHFKLKQYNPEQISEPPLFTLTLEQYYVEPLKIINGTVVNGRYELTNSKIQIDKVSLMPGRRVISCEVTCNFDEMIYYNDPVEPFINNILYNN